MVGIKLKKLIMFMLSTLLIFSALPLNTASANEFSTKVTKELSEVNNGDYSAVVRILLMILLKKTTTKEQRILFEQELDRLLKESEIDGEYHINNNFEKSVKAIATIVSAAVALGLGFYQ